VRREAESMVEVKTVTVARAAAEMVAVAREEVGKEVEIRSMATEAMAPEGPAHAPHTSAQ
jgi:hypothetical protein